MNIQLNKNKLSSSKLQIDSKIKKDEDEKDNTPKIKYEALIDLLKKPKTELSKEDKIEIQNYLCSNYEYFKNLLNQIDKETFSKLISNINYESFDKNSRVMNYGEEGDKFYIILKGRVKMCKPFPKETSFSLHEYINYLLTVRDIENNIAKFNRIQDYNSKVNKLRLLYLDYDITKIPETEIQTFIIEEEREINFLNQGETFGEISLIKNEPINSSVITLEKCDMISIEKTDYSKIKDIEEQRINNKLVEFRKEFPIFKYWPNSKCYTLINSLIIEHYNKGDYIYKQNDIPNSIYFIKEGILEVYTNFYLAWYEQFIEYIYDSTTSLTNIMDNPSLWKEDILQKKINQIYKDQKNPFVIKKSRLDNIIVSHNENSENEEDNIFNDNIKNNLNEEDNKKLKLVNQLEKCEENDKNSLYKANIQKLVAPQMFGHLEAMELKRRFCNIKCLSNNAIVLKFPFIEFLQLLPNDDKNQFYLQQRIFEEKKILIEQLKNNTLAKLNFMKMNNYKKRIMNIIGVNRKKKGIGNQFRCTKYLENKNESLYKAYSSRLFGKIEDNKKSEINKSKKNLINDNIFYQTNDLMRTSFKNTIIKLNKKNFEKINNLYPYKTKNKYKEGKITLNKRSFSNVNINYLGYSTRNKSYINNSPFKIMPSFSMSDSTARNYYNFDSNNNLIKRIKENKRNNKVLFPNINSKGYKTSINFL